MERALPESTSFSMACQVSPSRCSPRPCTHEGLQTVVRLNRVPEARSSNTNNASSTNPLPHCQQTRFHTLHTLTKTCHNPAPAPQATPPVLFRHDRAHAKSALCQPDPVRVSSKTSPQPGSHLELMGTIDVAVEMTRGTRLPLTPADVTQQRGRSWAWGTFV